MSNETAKFINSQRRHKTDVHIARQIKIAKQSLAHDASTLAKQPHRLAKHHAMDCGKTQCYLCGNPRKTHKNKLTVQEKRLFQDLDKVTDKHSNGLR